MEPAPNDLGPMHRRLRDVLAAGAAVAVAAGSLVALTIGRVDLGITFGIEGDRVVIENVDPGGPASREGFVPGMVVLSLNGVSLVRLPEPVAPDEEPGPSGAPPASPASSPLASAQPTLVPSAAPSQPPESNAVSTAGPSIEPPMTSSPAASVAPAAPLASPTAPPASPAPSPQRPEVVALDPLFLAGLLNEPIRQLDATSAADLGHFTAESPYRLTYLGRDYVGELQRSGFLFVAGLLVLSLGTWSLATRRAGEALRPMAVPLAAAVALPLLAQPLEATWTSAAMSLAAIGVPFGIAPLGLALADRVEAGEARGIARTSAVGAALLAMLLGVGRLWLPGASGRATDPGGAASDVIWILLAGGAAMVPGILCAARRDPANAGSSSGGVIQSNQLVVAGATPLLSLATGISSLPLFLPLSAWLAGIAIAGRWTVRPLVRVARRATLQRDLIVAATEAERARLAAEIHDDALQELTLLVRRLDEGGDVEGADIARTVSERLRAICGDLRLPILDDLGVGPALDWLVERMERLSGGPVRLERAGDARLPPDVELAFFRIAQEAVGNAVKHGRPPITIRYHASAAGASLAVDDSGPGIERAAAAGADEGGRFGILNMQQRAEQIGALLDIRPWPGGGTHVALEWRAP